MTRSNHHANGIWKTWWWAGVGVLLLWIMVLIGAMDNVTTLGFEAFRDWSSWIIALLVVICGALFAVMRWQYYRSPWEMDFRIAKRLGTEKPLEFQLSRSEVNTARGRYCLHITLRCHSMTQLGKANTALVIGARPTTRTVVREALRLRCRARQLKIWPSYTGWRHIISPRVEPHSTGYVPQIKDITGSIEGIETTAIRLTPIPTSTTSWCLSFEPQHDVAIGRAIHLHLELEAQNIWSGAMEFSGHTIRGDSEVTYRYVSRKLIFK